MNIIHYHARLIPIAGCLAAGIALSDLFAFIPTLYIIGACALGCLALNIPVLRRSRCNVTVLTLLSICLLGMLRGRMGDIYLPVGWLQSVTHPLTQVLHDKLYFSGLTEEAAGLVDAMLLGNKTSLSTSLTDLYRGVGASHLLALSGMHVGILFGVFGFVLFVTYEFPKLRLAVLLLTISLMLFYACVTGFPVSLVRAMLMLTIFYFGFIRSSGFDAWHGLAAAALVMLLISPSTLYTVSFQLSFTAVIGILLFYQPLSQLLKIENRPLRWFWNALMVSLSAQLGCSILSVYYFHHFSLYSVLMSPFYIILATAILYAAVAMLLLGAWLSPLLEGFVAIQHMLMRWVSLLPFADITNLQLTQVQVVLLYGALLCLPPAIRYINKWISRRNEVQKLCGR